MSQKKIELEFLARDKSGNKIMKLLIDISEWKEGQKSVFIKEFQEEAEKGKDYFLLTKQNHSEIKKGLWLFFLGIPDQKDPLLFHADNFKHIYFRFTDDFDLPPNYSYTFDNKN